MAFRSEAPIFGGVALNYFKGESTKKPSVAQTSILFSITIIVFVLLGYRVQSNEFYSGILITEFILISFPTLLFLIFSRVRMKEVLRLNKSRFMNFFVTFWIVVFAIPLAAVFNILNLFIVDKIFGKIVVEAMPVGDNVLGLLLSILVIAGSAGICEEFLFRGVVQRGFEDLGPVKSIFMAAFLFSLMHLDIQRIFGTFVLGVIIGFIVYKTNSLFCGMFAHFTNNAIAVTAGYVSNKLLEIFQKSSDLVQQTGNDISDIFDMFSSFPPQQLRIVIVTYGFMFIFFAMALVLLVYALIKLNPKTTALKPVVGVAPMTGAGNGQTNIAGQASVMGQAIVTGQTSITGGKAPRTSAVSVKGLLWLIPGFLVIGMWFYAQVCGFIGIENSFTHIFRIMIGAVG